MNPPPPCVSRSSPEWIKYQIHIWKKNNREHLNKYNREHYRVNILRERERHRLYYHGFSKKGTRPLPPNQIVDKLEADRRYREEMAAKGFIL
jgi:hypothetical protein